ncbi:polysaccharide pyruvyl transferase family protein [Butyrivibrio sp. MB2005]|uniref:polysaccharide pyruvyl transferase family protein n=1 Tax=Butyrivibrio sp. MB2005 TaxID=1280678 RepID=UPI000402821B|nr:polysaccharide pyruvyl transferase family protein [Butyrivibrio sp. MB2005]
MEDKIKVLITTLFYDNYNYGGILQAYALYHILENFGYAVEELNYNRTEKRTINKNLSRIKRLINITVDPINYLQRRKLIIGQCEMAEKYKELFPTDPIKMEFDKFISEEFLVTKLVYPDTIDTLPKYDCYIVGGDQMWNPTWFDKNYFLSFAKGKKIAYSCSIGKDNLSKKEKKKLKAMISSISDISVREKNIYDWLQQENVECMWAVDPVFLLTKEEWIEVSNKSKISYEIKTPYLFAYLLGDDTLARTKIKAFAKKNQLKIVAIPHVCRRYNAADENFADYSYMNVGPREYIKLILNAACVITDSFHGTAFSILFHKSFYSFCRVDGKNDIPMNSRLESILSEYNLTERLVNVNEIDRLDLDAVNYVVSDQYIEQRRKNSIVFMKNAINKK